MKHLFLLVLVLLVSNVSVSAQEISLLPISYEKSGRTTVLKAPAIILKSDSNNGKLSDCLALLVIDGKVCIYFQSIITGQMKSNKEKGSKFKVESGMSLVGVSDIIKLQKISSDRDGEIIEAIFKINSKQYDLLMTNNIEVLQGFIVETYWTRPYGYNASMPASTPAKKNERDVFKIEFDNLDSQTKQPKAVTTEWIAALLAYKK